MIEQTEPFELLASQLANADTQWSLGTFGAIAEFVRDRDEPVALSRSETAMSAVTDRGGLRLTPFSGMRLIASETTTRESWNHRLALCLRSNDCAMNRRTVLTELGPDDNALRPQDRGSILFDLGLDALQVDLCIRVSDADAAARVRTHAGRALFAPGNEAMAVILAATPHRVFVSRLGRIEVFQPIPPPDGKSPDGPHTHVLPRLLAHRRTHAATEPIPDGWIPCAHLYPAHPAKDAYGRPRPFDAARHEAFQAMWRRFGDPQLVRLKDRVSAAVVAGENPSALPMADSRFARTSVRVALRQMKACANPSRSLRAWIEAYDAPAHAEADTDEAVEQLAHG